MPPKTAVGPWSSEARKKPISRKPRNTASISPDMYISSTSASGGDPRFAADLECDHDGRAEERAERLLDEEIEGGLGLGAHLDRAGAQGADAVGQPQHALRGRGRCDPLPPPRRPRNPRRPGSGCAPRHRPCAARPAARRPCRAGGRGRRPGCSRSQRPRRCPGRSTGAMSRAKTSGITSSGRRTQTMSSEAAASRGTTSKPSHRAWSAYSSCAVADPDLDAGVAQVEGRAAAQMAIAEHGHPLRGQRPGERVTGPEHPDVALVWMGHRVEKVSRPGGGVSLYPYPADRSPLGGHRPAALARSASNKSFNLPAMTRRPMPRFMAPPNPAT